MNLEISEEKIEKLVRQRKKARAHEAIQRWLKQETYSVQCLIQASEWYRRIGDLTQAYQTIAPEEYRINSQSLTVDEQRIYLWSAQLLNLFGATSYAFQIAKTVTQLDRADELRVLANLYLSNYEPVHALKLFHAAEKLDEDSSSYSSRFFQIGTCDALAATGKNTQALIKLKKIPTFENEDLLKGILLQAEGEYLARAGKYEEALVKLKEASPFYPEEDQTFDFALLLKWTGIALMGMGKGKSGAKWIERAITVIKLSKHKPESWLDCLYWKLKLGNASVKEQEKLFSYPGVPSGLKKRYEVPSQFSVGSRKHVYWISLARREYSFRQKHFHDLPKEIELLALVRASGEDGLSLYRAFTLLWGEEVSSFLYLENRLTQLLNRLRSVHQIAISVRNKHLYLDEGTIQEIEVEILAAVQAPRIFDVMKQVSLEEVRQFYDLKKTQSFDLQKKWISSGKVEQKKELRKTYLIASGSGREKP